MLSRKNRESINLRKSNLHPDPIYYIENIELMGVGCVVSTNQLYIVTTIF